MQYQPLFSQNMESLKKSKSYMLKKTSLSTFKKLKYKYMHKIMGLLWDKIRELERHKNLFVPLTQYCQKR